MAKRASERINSHWLILLLVIIIIVLAGISGWSYWYARHLVDNNTNKLSHSQKAAKADPYAGWKTGTSGRSGFTIKYPASWTFNEAIGSKDGVEHITINSSHFLISIDSLQTEDFAPVGAVPTTCPDCQQTINSKIVDLAGLVRGSVQLKTVTYKLDSGSGNALVLMQPDGTYYLVSRESHDERTSFRGISKQDSESAYQAETSGQFVSNPDYETAQKILESVSYH